jgi:hypothetical protein
LDDRRRGHGGISRFEKEDDVRYFSLGWEVVEE